MKTEKTNAIRLLQMHKITFKTHEYPHKNGEFLSGCEVAKLLNQDLGKVFKTLVLVEKNHYYVCLVPVNSSIDIKKAAEAFSVKTLELVAVDDLWKITGYVRGGCSPLGMKKQFPIIVDITALNYKNIIFSAGKIGYQLEISPLDLKEMTDCCFADIKK